MLQLLSLFSLPLWVILVVVMVIALYMYGTQSHSTWKQLGIPGPAPLPYLGNAHEIKRLGMAEAFRLWREQYGPVVGVYFMRRPMLLISDINMLKHILVSDFHNFTNRGSPIPKAFMDDVFQGCLLFVEGEEWKRLRGILTPIFTAARLREKTLFINKASQKAVRTLLEAANNRESVPIDEIFRTFTIDVILGTLLSVDPDGNAAAIELFREHVPKMIRPSPFRLKMFLLSGMFPFLSSVLGKVADESKEARQFYVSFISQMAEKRRGAAEGTYKDFLENMAEAETEDSSVTRTKLTFKELVSQASLFFLAGNDTSSLVLTVLAYLLARHQGIQDRLVEEIHKELGDDMDADDFEVSRGGKVHPRLNYDSIQKLTLLKACILEALRLHPVISVFTRQSLQSTEIAGYPIPAGAGVYVPVKTICSDPDLFPDPEVFKPERFLKGHPENQVLESTGAGLAMFLPFGLGPRSCIGMRLGLYQIMMVMAEVLRKVRFVSAPGEFKLPRAVMFGIPPFKEPVMVEVEAREKRS
ncbi:cytochrome p450 [Plakobranchus ocellatus]|uniref:Cytochrome p450 n=1 Tax=Plakobranchus ocellatus TaxID=259542 RepID=A0AAV4A700_9GAST|nr:cytochrome p450 [Plakobranchus ocellatus]